MKELNDDFLLEDDDEVTLQENDEVDEDENPNLENEDNIEEELVDEEKEDSSNPFTESDSLNIFLQNKGIDPHSVLYENEEGEEESINFYDLDFEEQMNILNYKQDDYDLDEEEVSTINFLRENDIDLEEYTEYIKNKAKEEYAQENTVYTIDEYSDDDLFSAYLKNQYDNLSEEEIETELNKEKENPDLYSKKVEKIRIYYKEQEELEIQEKEKENEVEKEKELNEIKDVITKAAVSTNNFMGFELEDDDRREALRFIFEKDANGKSKFYKMFDDPDKLFRIALFALKEDEIYKTIDKELSKLSNVKSTISTKVNLDKVEKPRESKISINSKSSKVSSGSQHRIEDDLLNQLL